MRDAMLTDYELQEPGVHKIIEYFEKKLQELRVTNDGLNLDHTETMKIRGRIAEIKDFQSMMKPKRGPVIGARKSNM